MSHLDLEPEHAESMLRLIEAALLVKRRHQFYHWTQGDMQRLVPHRVSSCGAYDMGLRDLSFSVLNSVPLPDELLSPLSDTHSSVMTFLRAQWVKGNQQVCWTDIHGHAQHDPAARLLCDMGYRWLLTHGVSRPGRPQDFETFFVFGQPGSLPDEHSAYVLNLLLPYLHSTFLRVHCTERELSGMGLHARGAALAGGVDKPRPSASITEREREILRWVREGMSNQAISEELGISALTVKNHIQKILRKLGAANRAQAVAKAMSMNLFSLASEMPSRRAHGDSMVPSGT